ncbi:MAG TPA: tetratricopeptide repeat protein [Gemmatimonadales bacterium]|nr:tetratricopeptide repeat protein [Gemmatimonadales bacterium]
MRRAVAVALSAAALFSPRPALAQKFTAESLAALEARTQTDSEDADLHYRLGLAYWDKKRYPDAQRELQAAVAIDPQYAPAYLALGGLSFATHPKLEEQAEKGRISTELRPAFDSAQRTIRRAFLINPMADYRIPGSEPPTDQQITIGDYGAFTTFVLLVIGINSYSYGHYETAYSALNHYIERRYRNQPRDSVPNSILMLRGLSAAQLQQADTALSDFKTLLDRSVAHEKGDSLVFIPLQTNDYRYLIALVEQRAHRYVNAIRDYQEALSNDLGLYMAHVQLARIYEQNKVWTQAIEEAQRALQVEPDDASLQRQLGVILVEAGQAQAGDSVLRAAMVVNPRDPEIPYRLAYADLTLQRPADAKAAFARFLALAPSSWDRSVADAKAQLAKLP